MQCVTKAGKGVGAQPRRRASGQPLALEQADDQALLATRLCDLPIGIDGTLMDRRARRLHRELKGRAIVALPHVYLSEEFFNPDGVLGFAVPFYLAHPRLMRLERSQMLEVEGGTPEWCDKLLFHECGHAIDPAGRSQRGLAGAPG